MVLPRFLYTYNNLEVLKLRASIVLDVPEDVRLPSLKTLHLLCVEFWSVESACKLLSGCPVLEELVFDKSDNVSPPCFYIDVPSLKRLSILDTYRDEENDSDVRVVIKTPALEYLNVLDTCDSGLLLLSEKMEEMVVANVNVVFKSPETLMRCFTFIQSIPLLQGLKAELFAEKQEFVRKYVERVFEVLQSRFAIVKNHALL
ncbi:putative FBD-associated F-box protein [Raphanus sativus]|uniref:FBD-associated F-box protein At3g50710 n=1 Tax=Raphanus sativus TaxID=3726 RepID=A0A9W3DF19_RAPSA|nr:putative FBD-associated F-box protein At3g50710 [Raphanus sativus]KAJ4907730.1 putative FBD-associated F-box protein [Raphanus sativus]